MKCLPSCGRAVLLPGCPPPSLPGCVGKATCEGRAGVHGHQPALGGTFFSIPGPRKLLKTAGVKTRLLLASPVTLGMPADSPRAMCGEGVVTLLCSELEQR